MPIFRSTPARMTETGVGASTCASGNQVWNGNIGILMANPMKRPTKTIFANAKPRIGRALRNWPACALLRELDEVEGVAGGHRAVGEHRGARCCSRCR